MKKTLTIVCAILLFAGCSKEVRNPIIGTWALVEYTATNARTGKILTSTTDVKLWIFKEGGIAYVNGSTPMTYEIKGKTLTMTYVKSGVSQAYDIERLDDNILVVTWSVPPGYLQDPRDYLYHFKKME